MIITGRDTAKAVKVIESINSEDLIHSNGKVKPIEFIKSDCSNMDDVKKLAGILSNRFQIIDILVNNADIASSEFRRTKQGLEMTVGVNYLSPVYLTSLLLPMIQKADEGRIVYLSSRAYKDYPMFHGQDEYYTDFLLDDMAIEKFGILKTYARSKLGIVYFAQNLARLLETNGITNLKTASLHPGVVRTDIWSRGIIPAFLDKIGIIFYPIVWLLTKSEVDGAQTSLHLCCCPLDKLTNGAYYQDCDVESFTNVATDGKLMQASWLAASNRLKDYDDHLLCQNMKLPPHLDVTI